MLEAIPHSAIIHMLGRIAGQPLWFQASLVLIFSQEWKLGKCRSHLGVNFCLTYGNKDDLFLLVACQPGAAAN